ncbi:MAG: TlpA family protein disulfide reductase [Candidatus Aenigmarchaeota archaeon]|nr:TlpA family protein disulfide reductase [Candidatus Aenigmarchaeota archaeon]
MRIKAIMALNVLLLAFILWSHFEIDRLQPTGFAVSGISVGTEVGDIAPYFKAKLVDGTDITSEEIAGKPVIIYFFASWCPTCREEFETLKAVYPKYSSAVRLIAIDMDGDESDAAKYRDSMGYDWDFAVSKEMIIDYEALRASTTYIISKDGIILYKKSGALDKDNWEKALERLSNSLNTF